MRKLVTLTVFLVILSVAGCEAIIPPTPEEKMEGVSLEPLSIDDHWKICRGINCHFCDTRRAKLSEAWESARPSYDAKQHAFHFGDAVTITQGFYEGSRGIVYDAAEKGYHVCLDVTERMEWTRRRAGVEQSSSLFNVPESCLAPYERPDPDLAPVAAPSLPSPMLPAPQSAEEM